MAFIDINYAYQIDATLIGKRKNRLYNVLNHFVGEIQDIDFSELRPIGMEILKSESDKVGGPPVLTLNPHYEFDGNVYKKSSLIWNGEQEEAKDYLKDLFQKTKDIANIEYPKNAEILEKPNPTIENLEKSKYFIHNSFEEDVPYCDVEEIKIINNTNQEYKEKQIKETLSGMIVVDGVIYTKYSDPHLYIPCRYNSNDKYDSVYMPFFLEDVSPDFIKNQRNDIVIYDMEIFDKKEDYGKILYDACFGTTLDYSLRSLGVSIKDINEDIFFDKIKRHYDFGEELVEKIYLAKKDYELSKVLDAISFVGENYNKFFKKKNYIGNIKRYDKEYPSDSIVMQIPNYFSSFIDDIMLSYNKNPSDKNNVFADIDTKKNIDFSELFLNHSLKL